MKHEFTHINEEFALRSQRNNDGLLEMPIYALRRERRNGRLLMMPIYGAESLSASNDLCSGCPLYSSPPYLRLRGNAAIRAKNSHPFIK